MIYLLVIYFIFLAFYIVYSILAVYHLSRFGFVGDLTKPATVIYILLSAGVMVFSIIVILSLDWTAQINL